MEVIIREQVKQILRKYIREQIEKTVAGGRSSTVPATNALNKPQQQSSQDLEQMIVGLQSMFKEIDKRKLQQSKRDPSFRNDLNRAIDLVAELQSLLEPLN